MKIDLVKQQFNRFQFLIVGIILILVVLFFGVKNESADTRLEKSRKVYEEALNDIRFKDEAILLAKKMDIRDNDSNEKIVLKIEKYFRNHNYKYNTKIESPLELSNALKGDCKDFTLAYASILSSLDREYFFVIRDKFNNGKESKFGHVYLALPSKYKTDFQLDRGEYVKPFETTPAMSDENTNNPFKRVEKNIFVEGNIVKKLYFKVTSEKI